VNSFLCRRIVFPLKDFAAGKHTLRALRELERTQWLDHAALTELQLARLKSVVSHAYRNVPYYRSALDEQGIAPEAMARLEDVRLLPLLTKEVVRRSRGDLLARQGARVLEEVYTSGTTGEATRFAVDADARSAAFANQLRGRAWHGFSVGARELKIWGRAGSRSAAGFYDRFIFLLNGAKDRLLNVRTVSAHELSPAAVEGWIAAVRRHRPELLYGYAAAVYFLARLIELRGLPFPGGTIRTVFVTAEKIDDAQKSLIERVFGATVREEYGSAECGVIAFECPKGRLHTSDETLLTEVLNPDADGVGDLVVTHLGNYAMPLLRYRTGDLVARSSDPCPCGRSAGTLSKVVGRRESLIRRPSGGYLHPFVFMLFIQRFGKILKYRITQRSTLGLEVLLQLQENLTQAEETDLIAYFESQLGPGGKVVLRRVAEIPVARGGKYQFIASEVADV
jgi:phenylacetate-CoA ligase